MMEDPKTGGTLSVLLIWLGAVYDYLLGGLANISIFVGIVLGLVTIYCTLARHFREQREYLARMEEYRLRARQSAGSGSHDPQ